MHKWHYRISHSHSSEKMPNFEGDHTFTRTVWGTSHIYSYDRGKVTHLLVCKTTQQTSSPFDFGWETYNESEMLAHLTLVYVRWAKPTLIKDGGNFSCSRLCNIFLVHTLLGPRDNLFSEDFHLLKCQNLVRLAEYPRSKNQHANKIQHIPFQACRIFFVLPINFMWEQHLLKPNMICLP